MNNFRKTFILILCFIPFFRDLLKLLYTYALKKIKHIASEHQEIVDIYLTSKMGDKDFIYGSSDLDLIFVVENKSHPRQILIEIRQSLKNIWPINMLVDLDNLHVFKEAEIKTPLIRSCLNRQKVGKTITWKSILSQKDFQYSLKEQDHFSIQRHYVKKIEVFLLSQVKPKLSNRHWIRSFGKNIYRSINGLHQYAIIKAVLPDQWKKSAIKLIGLSWFSRMYMMSVKVLTFRILDFEPIPEGKGLDIPEEYPNRLNRFCERLLDIPIIEDIILSPALIQLNSDEIKGKINIELVMGQSQNPFTADLLNHICELVDEFIDDCQEYEPRYVFHFSTYSFIKLKSKFMLGTNPLESVYRYQRCHSFMDIRYQFKAHKGQLEKAAINYLLKQFMQFRSMEHKTHLIGSRFIKSLNIIYRYQLLLHDLKGKEFAVSHSYTSIMEEITPQLSHLKPHSEVTKELWPLIRAQMLYTLKQIRDELAHKNPSLKNLQF